MRILCLEDDPNSATLIEAILAGEGRHCALERVETRTQFETALARSDAFDLILADYALPSFNGMAALGIARRLAPEIPFIFVSGSLGEEIAIESLRNGATDYLLKDNLSRLVPVIDRALKESVDRRERLQAISSLRESEERFRLLIENSNDLVAEICLDGLAVYASPNHERLLGHAPADIVGSNVLDLVHPDDRPRLAREFDQDVATTSFRCRHRDGHWRWLEAAGRRFRTSDGSIHVVVVSRDITERRAAEKLIAEQARLLELASDAIVVCDLEDRVRYWNSGAGQIFGWSAKEAAGRILADLIKPVAAPYAEARAALSRTGRWNGELRLRHQNGSDVFVSLRLTRVESADDGPPTVLAIGTDVTEKHHLESQLHRAQRLEGVGLLASGIAHDLNNVLAPILMAAPLLQSETLDPENRELLTTITTSAQRGADMVKQILGFTRGSEAGRSVLDPRLLLNEIIRLTRETFPRAIRVQAQLPAGLWPVNGDPTQLHQVFLNLCINARDAMPEGGQLVVRAENVSLAPDFQINGSVRQLASFVKFSITDTGEGIPEEIRERIFEPFFTTKQPGKGTGLGLASVRNIINGHGGFLRVESSVGMGTTFEIFLPCAATMEPVPGEGQGKEKQRGSGELILVVDDEVQIREVSRRILELNGYRVETAGDGVEAITAFSRNRDSVQVLITDTDMPRMDGKALIRVLLRMRPNLRIIASGGQLTQSDREAFRKLSVHEFLDKPYLPERLLSAAHHVIHEDSQGQPGTESVPVR
ncbi:MAG TPA: hypothetical protein DCY13_07580 [Verrucomicrobiales bacterium]|nr:hypothetical protein [Verrucomicrobiales bacterium]